MKRLALLVLLFGCDPVNVDPWNPRVTPTPVPTATPTPTDDDDATDPIGPSVPVLIVLTPDPVDPIAGDVTLSFALTDADSTTVGVQATWQRADGATGPVTFADHQAGEATFELGPPPHEDATVEATWTTAADLPGDTEVRLELCPIDAEGQVGDCVGWPADPVLVANGAVLNPGAFCQPGHREPVSFSAGQAVAHLSDGVCLNYDENIPPQPDDFQARFLLLLTNPNDAAVEFRITRTEGQAGSPGGQPAESREASTPPSPAPAPLPSAPRDCPDDASVHFDAREFLVPDSLLPGATRTTYGAQLRALGETVAVYVDTQTPIDIDWECDGVVDVPSPNGPAAGFDNCDLTQVVDVFDRNISATLATHFGAVSDVDESCRVTVFVSHRINTVVGASGAPIRSFADPGVDLWQRDLAANPGSNEEEILFVHAPDPLGLWASPPLPLADYLDYELAARLATGLQQLISYQRRLDVTGLMDPADAVDLARGPAQAGWLDDGLGLLAADLSGFGAAAWPDAWRYLDAPHLAPLRGDSTLGGSGERGGPYLFARYLVDRFGVDVVGALMEADGVGAAGVAEATGLAFGDLVGDWAEAMAVSGLTDSGGQPLVDASALPLFAAPTTVVVTEPEVGAAGELFGANGFQQGFAVAGINHVRTGGTDPAGPTEDPEQRIVTGHLDPLVWHPQFDFHGRVAGGDGVAAILIDGLAQPSNHLLIETAGGEDLRGRLVRVHDGPPSDPNLTIEGVSGALLSTAWPVSTEFSSLGGHRVLGRIEAPGPLVVVHPDGSQTTELVADTDRFRLDLPALGTWVVELARRADDLSGEPGLGDVFLAVAPSADVPDLFDVDAWVHPTCPAGAYNPPSVVPAWVHAQGALLADPGPAGVLPEPPVDSYACEGDANQDGVLDQDEPVPANLSEQIRLQQARNLAADLAVYDDLSLVPGFEDIDGPFFGPALFDFDTYELPDDDVATALMAYGAGGRSVAQGEDAVWVGVLGAGSWDVVVGAADGSTGTYVLRVRQILPQ